MTALCAGQVALVTGASRGLGQAVAVRLAAEGALVAAVGRTGSADSGANLAGSLAETVQLAEAAGGRAIAVVADITVEGQRQAGVERAAAEFGAPVSILVNNAAGPRGYDRNFATMTSDLFEAAVGTNVWAAWDLALLTIPGMRANGQGWILNISSVQAAPRVGPPYAESAVGSAALYGATKAMIDRLTTAAAMDLFDDHIAVNALSPEASVLTPHSAPVASRFPHRLEPVETFAAAALALVTGDPNVLTGRIAYSLSLIKELGLEVRSLEGAHLVDGWQPSDIDRARLFSGYLRS